jgi:hypothetical protein
MKEKDRKEGGREGLRTTQAHIRRERQAETPPSLPPSSPFWCSEGGSEDALFQGLLGDGGEAATEPLLFCRQTRDPEGGREGGRKG